MICCSITIGKPVFSGIIETVGTVRAATPAGDAQLLKVSTGLQDIALGESIAVNGVCLTVAKYNASGEVEFFASTETLSRSNLGKLRVGSRVNIERSVTLSTRLSGHLVQGHVDGKAELSTTTTLNEATSLSLTLPQNLYPYCVEKGSIAIDGISLTINALGRAHKLGHFSVAITIIPHTWCHTNLQFCSLGDELNVEVDVLAKYVERLCRAYPKQ